AAFFCLLFFAAAKKSRCRPAQGRRLERANESRMPAQTLANQSQRPRHDAKTANASKKAKRQKQKAKNHIPNPSPRPR
ncbi:hypothetical protein, partial [Paraburkholderia caribensis]|uniref:hypothetical protein n=1 Tax=Paraburkholderia caribensis TaxID=75105 RepID=UPI0020905DB5